MGDILRYRSQLMAFAIFGVLICHYTWLTDACRLFVLGSLGVEIFFFLSGMGLVLSWMKDQSPIHYYKKRILRICPSYYIAIAFLILLSHFWGQVDNRMYASFFIIGSWMWFISYIFILYLVFPFYMFLSKKINPVLLFCMIVVGTLLAMNSLRGLFPEGTWCMQVGRIPSFFMGCLIAQRPALLNRRFTWGIAFFVALAALYLCLCIDEMESKKLGIVCLFRMILTPYLCFVLVGVCMLLERVKLRFIVSFLAFIGSLTLEIYIMEGYFSAELRRSYPLIMQPVGWIPVLLSAYLIHKMSNVVRTFIERRVIARFSA